ncbi:UDP-N-acetylmuramoyl-tripeptide--D-alanyl-D-alanine ligase [Nisaea acidiphila]|uniref:UDP-N-acetylmuramoyl-tripeptide--D-alanyl-D-alanine ligase n=1 Tax=Nisaea acidiphila TaxID=1862145 RepID=A0A9J7APF5_9PROT|nr:UDP-N-acetylmuramoyl-tripeptide--D-alanyl-D-alanine ligase [Nisaea acidiphila]UUX49095.1 UDP-N-acetylmuramoyl-tripeptide--D-alanyl-D-alanine ligase [Nisaea acidiphila]
MTALWTSDELKRATRGTLHGPAFEIADLVIDSRKVTPGCLFVALPGERVDGHDFVGAALEAGAAAALVGRIPAGLEANAPLLEVEDVLGGLRDIAAAARARTGATVLAVTGSVGKTGTKDSLAAALSVFGEVHASAGNLNNHIGAPLSLARLPQTADYAVLELGMNHLGEISELTRLVRPDLTIITNVEETHIGHFRDVEQIAEAKSEIFEGLKEDEGLAVLNRDNAHFYFCAERAEATGARIVSFGRSEDADVRLIGAECGPEGSNIVVRVEGRQLVYRIDGIGMHWAFNSVGVLACIHALGLDLQKAARAIREVSAKAGRGKQEEIAFDDASLLLIDESYNASPASVTAALDVLSMTKPKGAGRRIAVLGDMLELGDRAEFLHLDLLAKVCGSADLVFTVGPMMDQMIRNLPPMLVGGHGATAEEVAPMVAAELEDGDVVLVKGSLGMGMAPIVAAIRALPENQKTAPRNAAYGG